MAASVLAFCTYQGGCSDCGVYSAETDSPIVAQDWTLKHNQEYHKILERTKDVPDEKR